MPARPNQSLTRDTVRPYTASWAFYAPAVLKRLLVGLADLGPNVDFRDSPLHRLKNILLSDSRSAVEDERNPHGLPQLVEVIQRETRLDFLLVPGRLGYSTVDIPDGDRKPVASCFPDEQRGLIGSRETLARGKQLVIRGEGPDSWPSTAPSSDSHEAPESWLSSAISLVTRMLSSRGRRDASIMTDSYPCSRASTIRAW